MRTSERPLGSYSSWDWDSSRAVHHIVFAIAVLAASIAIAATGVHGL